MIFKVHYSFNEDVLLQVVVVMVLLETFFFIKSALIDVVPVVGVLFIFLLQLNFVSLICLDYWIRIWFLCTDHFFTATFLFLFL